jgi:hypothetical protein
METLLTESMVLNFSSSALLPGSAQEAFKLELRGISAKTVRSWS